MRTLPDQHSLPRFRAWRPALMGLGSLFLSACAAPSPGAKTAAPNATRDRVAWVAPRCAGVQSCVLGRVTASESSRPLSRAAVFLEQQDAGGGDEGDAKAVTSLRLQAVTDDDGVFIVEDPPPGRYRLAVYKDARHVEVRGLQLGGEGTTLLPVSLAP